MNLTDWVFVSRPALDAFIEYAQGLRFSVEQEYCVGVSEVRQSQAEFDALVAALYQ